MEDPPSSCRNGLLVGRKKTKKWQAVLYPVIWMQFMILQTITLTVRLFFFKATVCFTFKSSYRGFKTLPLGLLTTLNVDFDLKTTSLLHPCSQTNTGILSFFPSLPLHKVLRAFPSLSSSSQGVKTIRA